MAKARVLVPASIRDIFDYFLSETQKLGDIYGRITIQGVQNGDQEISIYCLDSGDSIPNLNDSRFQLSIDNLILGMAITNKYDGEKKPVEHVPAVSRFQQIAARLW